eukprot:1555191-Prymnesium_polylepis.1
MPRAMASRMASRMAALGGSTRWLHVGRTVAARWTHVGRTIARHNGLTMGARWRTVPARWPHDGSTRWPLGACSVATRWPQGGRKVAARWPHCAHSVAARAFTRVATSFDHRVCVRVAPLGVRAHAGGAGRVR